MTLSRLRAEDAVLLVVDMQEKLVPTIHGHPGVISSIRLMMRAARALDMPVLLTTQYAKGLGSTDPRIMEMAPEVTPIDKTSFSCFGSGDFKRALEGTGRPSLILCGVESHICVLQTGLDARALGRDVHLVTDASSSYNEENKQRGQRRLEQAGCVLTTTEMAVFELLGASGSPAFKSLLPALQLARNEQETK